MLFKEIRDAYERYAISPSDDPLFHELSPSDRHERYQRNLAMQQLLEHSQSFVIDAEAFDVVNTLEMEIKSGEELGPLMDEAPLPFNSNWFEFEECISSEENGQQRYRSGVLMRKTDTGTFACCYFKVAGGGFMEPFIFISTAKNEKVDATLSPHPLARLLSMLDGSNEERLREATLSVMRDAGLAISTVVRTMHLIATRQGPLDMVAEPLLSRQERRQRERQGRLPKGTFPSFTHIRINEQGRLHLAAVDEEEGGAGGARRRAHRVRGHFMRKASGGKSWRTAHLRGFGSLRETMRTVGVVPTANDPELL